MQRKMIKLAGLAKTEHVQDKAQIASVLAAIGANADEIIWDDQPAIIVDEMGNILDGHHRVEAALAAGLAEWPGIVVDRAEWDAKAAVSHQHAAQWACDEAADYVTWGSV